MSDAAPLGGGLSVVAELGLRVDVGEGVARGRTQVQAFACVPGTDVLRTSVLATWADVVTGTVAGHAMSPRIPLTLDLEVQLQQPVTADTSIVAEAHAEKVGRTVLVAEALISDAATGALLATGIGSFIASPNPEHVFPDGFPSLAGVDRRLSMPFAERVGVDIVEPGVAEVPDRPGNMNASGAIQCGLLSLAAEEATTSRFEGPAIIDSMNIRYLRPFSSGPARAVAAGRRDAAVVRLTNVATGKLGAIVTTRSSPITS